MKSLKKQEIQDTNYKNELEKACFQYGMDPGDFKNLAKGTASDIVL